MKRIYLMLLRDFFAGMALAGFFAHPDNGYSFTWKNKTSGEIRMLGHGAHPVGPDWEIVQTPSEAMGRAMWKAADDVISQRDWREP